MSQSPAGVPTCYRHPGRETYIRCQRCDRPICPDCMREAPVGFHCPDDAALGRRSVPRQRTSVGAALRDAPPYVTAVLVALNVVVYAVTAVKSAGGLDDPHTARLFLDWRPDLHLVAETSGKNAIVVTLSAVSSGERSNATEASRTVRLMPTGPAFRPSRTRSGPG